MSSLSLDYSVSLYCGREDKKRHHRIRISGSRRDPYNIDENGREFTVPKERMLASPWTRKPLILPPEDLIAQSKAFEVQTKSALLRLLCEIRNNIWKEALGGRVIHLWYSGNSSGHIICAYRPAKEGAEEWNYLHGCRYCWNGRSSNGDEKLGLISTCRAM